MGFRFQQFAIFFESITTLATAEKPHVSHDSHDDVNEFLQWKVVSKFLMMMLSFGLINPMMFMMLAQQQSENFDEELKDYLVDQWANGKKRLSIDFHKDHLPIEYNFLNQLDGFGGANSGFLNDNNNMFSSIPYQYSNPFFDMG